MASYTFEQSVHALFGPVSGESLYELKLLAFFSILALLLLLANIVYWRLHSDTLSEVYLNPQKFSIDGDAALISHVTVGVEYKVASAQAAADTVAGIFQEGLHGEQVPFELIAAPVSTPTKSSSSEAPANATRSARTLSGADGVQLGRFTIPRSLNRSPPPSSVGRSASFRHGHVPSDLTPSAPPAAFSSGERDTSPTGVQELGEHGSLGAALGRPPRHSQARVAGVRAVATGQGTGGAGEFQQTEGFAPAPASPASIGSTGPSQQRFTSLLQSVQGLATSDAEADTLYEQPGGEERSEAGSVRSGGIGAGRRSTAEGSMDGTEGASSAALEGLLGPLIDDGDSVVEDGDSVFIEHPPSAVKARRGQEEEEGARSPANYGFSVGAEQDARDDAQVQHVGHSKSEEGMQQAAVPSPYKGTARKRASRQG